MICASCKEDKYPSTFRDKSTGLGKRATCRECEAEATRARYMNGRERKRAGHRGRPDREDWYKPQQPWPWAPGEIVFDDVRMRNKP